MTDAVQQVRPCKGYTREPNDRRTKLRYIAEGAVLVQRSCDEDEECLAEGNLCGEDGTGCGPPAPRSVSAGSISGLPPLGVNARALDSLLLLRRLSPISEHPLA